MVVILKLWGKIKSCLCGKISGIAVIFMARFRLLNSNSKKH